LDPQPPEKTAGLPILLVSVFIIATCGILYELLISSISSYFLGSSILQFSLTIGLFMFFMGVGSYLTRFFHDHLLDAFVWIEIGLGLVGGLSAIILYFSYSLTEHYYLVAFGLIAALGTGIGLEIPLVTRLVKNYATLKDTIAQVLSFDYVGALVASVLFPLVLLPYLGTMRTAFLVGILNLGVAYFNSQVFAPQLRRAKQQQRLAGGLMVALGVGFVYSFQINTFFEQFIYQDEIVLTKQSAYQRLVLTKWNQDLRLYIDGALQFSTTDEYRYHEPLVHVPFGLARNRERVLILGGGDGLAVREMLKYPDVGQIEVVDLDPDMTALAKDHPLFQKINGRAFNHPKVHIHNQDAYKFIEESSALYSVILVDLPDPKGTEIGKLYTKEFYKMAQKRLAKDGVMVTQATSPYFANPAYWCIVRTLREVYPWVRPYQAYVPSFGQWGFVLVANQSPVPAGALPQVPDPDDRLARFIFQRLGQHLPGQALRYLDEDVLSTLFVFDNDTGEEGKDSVRTNTLDNQVLVQYYEQSLKEWQ
jgi:spermidine synthase